MLFWGILGDTIDSYAAETGAAVAEHFETITKTYPIYVVKNDGEEFCLCQAPLGAPAAAQFMDCLIACGCRKIVTAGSCGVLTEMAENEFLIPTKAQPSAFQYATISLVSRKKPSVVHVMHSRKGRPSARKVFSMACTASEAGSAYRAAGR